VSYGNHYSELNTSGEDAAAETNKDLSEGNEAYVGVWCPEWDEKSSTDKKDRYTAVCGVFEVTGCTYDPKWE
jgi:hypothetical protein